MKNPLLETSRNGYLAAVSASSYSFVSLVKYFGPVMAKGGSVMNLSYLASEKVVPVKLPRSSAEMTSELFSAVRCTFRALARALREP